LNYSQGKGIAAVPLSLSAWQLKPLKIQNTKYLMQVDSTGASWS
jgi:hypothetical protein